MYASYPPQSRRPIDTGVIQDLTKAINGEYSAIQCYEQLARSAPNETIRKRILEIREDELQHFHTFSRLYTTLTGRAPAPQPEPCPKGYKDSLQHAFRDEQETVDFYNSAADRASAPAVRAAFRRAALDEQNHAVWFLYYLTAAKG